MWINKCDWLFEQSVWGWDFCYCSFSFYSLRFMWAWAEHTVWKLHIQPVVGTVYHWIWNECKINGNKNQNRFCDYLDFQWFTWLLCYNVISERGEKCNKYLSKVQKLLNLYVSIPKISFNLSLEFLSASSREC